MGGAHQEELGPTSWALSSLKTGQEWLPILQMEIMSQRRGSDLFSVSCTQLGNIQLLWPCCHIRARYSPWSQGDSREGPGCTYTLHSTRSLRPWPPLTSFVAFPPSPAHQQISATLEQPVLGDQEAGEGFLSLSLSTLEKGKVPQGHLLERT